MAISNQLKRAVNPFLVILKKNWLILRCKFVFLSVFIIKKNDVELKSFSRNDWMVFHLIKNILRFLSSLSWTIIYNLFFLPVLLYFVAWIKHFIEKILGVYLCGRKRNRKLKLLNLDSSSGRHLMPLKTCCILPKISLNLINYLLSTADSCCKP